MPRKTIAVVITNTYTDAKVEFPTIASAAVFLANNLRIQYSATYQAIQLRFAGKTNMETPYCGYLISRGDSK